MTGTTVRTLALGAMLLPSALISQQRLPTKMAAKPTAGAITPADLMSRVYVFADDSMMGRETGTVYHDKGTNYIARELTRLGLKPAGDNGTFFQTLPFVSRSLASDAAITVEGKTYAPWTDFLPRDNAAAAKPMNNAVAVYGGVFGDTAKMIPVADAAGKVVVFSVPRGYQANRPALLLRYPTAAGIAIATLDSVPPPLVQQLREPQPMLSGTPSPFPPVAFFYTTRALADAMFGAPVTSLAVGTAGKPVSGSMNFSEAPMPGSRNVVAILPGSDPVLKNQYVAIGAHSDHIGFGPAIDHDSLLAFYHIVRPGGADDNDKNASASDWPKIRVFLDSVRKIRPPRQDSINNGADDDASGSMGMLEVAEAFATASPKPKRSILFVWHVGEEQGLFGSKYFTDHPTVPRDSIVAQINIDMIGRGGAQDTPGGGPGYVQLIGSRRLSTELGDIVEAEGKKGSPPFKFDYTYDANGHPGQYYCRSDHYEYAKYGIPVVFLSTGGHPEYHQITDEPQYLDYDQLTRVAQLVYNIASHVANLDHRVRVDKPKPDPKGQCRQ